nr:potassium-transporting ATPase subunit KdpA [Planctomycetota bacterium]
RMRCQVFLLKTALVVTGGMGFGTLYNLATVGLARLRRSRPDLLSDRQLPFERIISTDRPARLTVTTRLVLAMTALLLVIGTAWLFFFEAAEGGTLEHAPFGQRLADAWFQSVVSRTAGFNTIDLSQLRPASMLLAIVLMFIGAAPDSTGGGVKVTAVAVACLAIIAIMRGRPQAEAFGRSIPDEIVKRALTVIAIGVSTLFSVSLLLAAFENDAQFRTIEILYEAASACGTVGVSAGITAQLTPASQVVLMFAMFLGRIGPLTLLLGLAGQRQGSGYDLPDERVTLG